MVDVSPPRIPSIIGPHGEINHDSIRLLERFLNDLWMRTGGSNDTVSDNQIQELYPWPAGKESFRDENVSKVIFNRSDKDQYIITTSTDFTTTSSTRAVICDGSMIITLNDSPDENEVVTIKRLQGVVSVNPNGKTIDDNSNDYSIGEQYWSLDFAYSVENDGWYVI